MWDEMRYVRVTAKYPVLNLNSALMVFILHIAHWLMYFHNAHCISHFTFCKLHLAQGCEAGKLPDWFAWLSQSGDHSHGEVQMVS